MRSTFIPSYPDRNEYVNRQFLDHPFNNHAMNQSFGNQHSNFNSFREERNFFNPVPVVKQDINPFVEEDDQDESPMFDNVGGRTDQFVNKACMEFMKVSSPAIKTEFQEFMNKTYNHQLWNTNSRAPAQGPSNMKRKRNLPETITSKSVKKEVNVVVKEVKKEKDDNQATQSMLRGYGQRTIPPVVKQVNVLIII